MGNNKLVASPDAVDIEDPIEPTMSEEYVDPETGEVVTDKVEAAKAAAEAKKAEAKKPATAATAAAKKPAKKVGAKKTAPARIPPATKAAEDPPQVAGPTARELGAAVAADISSAESEEAATGPEKKASHPDNRAPLLMRKHENVAELAEQIGVSRSALAKWFRDGEGPKYAAVAIEGIRDRQAQPLTLLLVGDPADIYVINAMAERLGLSVTLIGAEG